ncbi:hypothetical protein [Thermodesulfatator indicus]
MNVFLNIMILLLCFLFPVCVLAQNQLPPVLNQSVLMKPPPGAPPPLGAPHPPGAPPPPGVMGFAPQVPVILNNLPQAVATAKQIEGFLSPGKVWVKRGPRGDIEVKGAILYQNSVVGVIDFNPINGEPLPKGIHVFAQSTEITLQKINEKLIGIVKNLKVLPAAEFREPEASWVFPVAYKQMIVAHIKIYHDGLRVVPDYPAQQEMKFYAR